MLLALGETTQVAASARPARRVRLRPVEQPRSVRGVTDEHLGDTTRVVEADEQLGNDEAALRKAGPLVRESHRRLEPCDDVVAHEADDRPPERLGLLEADDPGAAADEGVAPEPASLDRFEQERSARAFAQPEVGPERGEEVGCDLSGHGHRKTAPEGAGKERNGVCASTSAQAPAPLGAPAPPAAEDGSRIHLLTRVGAPAASVNRRPSGLPP